MSVRRPGGKESRCVSVIASGRSEAREELSSRMAGADGVSGPHFRHPVPVAQRYRGPFAARRSGPKAGRCQPAAAWVPRPVIGTAGLYLGPQASICNER